MHKILKAGMGNASLEEAHLNLIVNLIIGYELHHQVVLLSKLFLSSSLDGLSFLPENTLGGITSRMYPSPDRLSLRLFHEIPYM